MDLSGQDTASLRARLAICKALSPEFEGCVALRGERQFIQQIQPAPLPAVTAPPKMRDDGVYIITGGLGGLGLETARWLVEKGARHLVLLGRQACRIGQGCRIPTIPTPTNTGGSRRCASRGVTVETRALDVRDTDALSALFEGFAASDVPVRGVVHAAGENWCSKILELDPQRFLDTLKTKVSATLALNELTKHSDLDCFIIFSSVSAFWGSDDLSHYGAANQFADMLGLMRSKGDCKAFQWTGVPGTRSG